MSRDMTPMHYSLLISRGAGRFECRWAQVTVLPSPAVMLDGMAGSTMGIWTAHGEGRCHFPDEQIEELVLENDLAPVRYADTDGRPTSSYPSNPNGSPHGIAALCSADGRHLAMMPHPERYALCYGLRAVRCVLRNTYRRTCSRPVTELKAKSTAEGCKRTHILQGLYTFNLSQSPSRVCDLWCACRCYLGWQLPWFPEDSGLSSEGPGPWLKLFQNARAWLVAQK